MEQWGVITGASAGIGAELAKLAAAAGYNLVLIARNESRLKALAEELAAAHPVQALPFACDLSKPGAAAAVFHEIGHRPVSMLVNNAGFGRYGYFVDADLEIETELMQVNMVALVQLTRLFLPAMLQRRNGRILNVASTAAFQPGPAMNLYYASKAFVYSFSYALADELQGSGVTVTTLCPGLTRTEFFARAHLRMHWGWPMMEPRTVALAGFRGLMRGKRVVLPGLLNWLTATISRRMPPRLTSAVVRRLHRPE